MSVCGKCNNAIVGQGVQAIGKTWHKECFVCDYCKQEFGNGSFILKYDRPFCKACEGRLFGNYCKKCNQPIEGQSIKAMNALWHPDHFQCSRCKTTLTSGAFVEKNYRPFCSACALAIP